MLKLTGSVLIIISGAMIGILKSEKLKSRYEALKKIISALTLLENEISYAKCDLKTALKSIGSIQKLPAFYEIGGYLDSFNIQASFKMASGTLCRDISKKDCEILSVLFQTLGMTDTKTQISSIRHTKSLLENCCAASFEDYTRLGRLYRSAGFLSGLLFVILLF